MKKAFSNLFIVVLLFASCTDYLSEREANFIPYKPGDILVFENSNNKSTDTIYISKLDRYVPDGPQINFNEHIDAKDRNKDYIVSLSAGYGKHSNSYIKIRGLEGKHYLKDIEKKTETSLITRTMRFNDVVILEKKEKRGNIIRVYWSKSKGIVQFVEKDQAVWQLISLSSFNE